MEKYVPQEPNYLDDSTEIRDKDFYTDGSGLFDPRRQYAPESLSRHRALSSGISPQHHNRLGLEGLVLALPWWEPCKNTVPAGKTELARESGNINSDGSIDSNFKDGSENVCIYVDSDKYDIISGEPDFGYWKTEITNQLNTEACFTNIYVPNIVSPTSTEQVTL